MTTFFQPQRMLVTGGCGFIGSNFIRWLLSPDSPLPECQIINLDALTYAGNLENLAEYENHSRYQFIKADLCRPEQYQALLQELQLDSVVHFAAESHVDRSILDSGPFIRTNVLGTQVLLDVCRRLPIKRFLQVSTDEVYGSLGATGLFMETTPLSPNSPYSASKAAADLLMLSYCHTFDFPGLITRCSNNYGPYQFPEKLIPLFIANAWNDQPLPVYGDGLQVRDWIYVLDHCRGILAALQRGQLGQVYNFGGRCELENLTLIRQLLNLLNKPESLIQFVQDRPGHDRRYAIDCTKAEEELGWQPQVSFAQGMEQTIAWYGQNRDWIERVRSGQYRDYYQTQYGDRIANK